MDGSKVFVPVQTGNTALVDLVEGTEKTIATGNTPDWVGQSHDYNYAIASDYYMAVISFETGAIISSINGISIQNGAVSKSGNHIVASDPLRNEVVLFYEFESPGSLNFIESRPTGSDLEADATYSVSFTPDGEKVVAVNSISGTVSILTTATGALEKIIDLNTFEIYHAGITPDGKYALIAKRNTNTVAVIDLETLELVNEVNSGGVKPDQVFVTPDGKNALAINAGSSDACGVISLTGAPSYVKQFSIANTGISWTNFGIRSSVEFDPIEPYAYLAAPFDEEIQVIDLQSLSPIYSLPLTGFPLQMAISDETEFGIFTAVTQKNENALAIIGGSGNNISLIGSYPCGNNPTRVAYNPAKEQFAVTCTGEGTLEYFDINTLSYESPISFGSTMSPISVKYSKTGHEYVLLRSSDVDVKPHQLVIDGTSYDIPALPMHNFDVSSDGTKVAIPLPATDEVALFLNGPSGWEERIVSTKANAFEIFPNPVVDFLNIKETEVYTLKENHQFMLYDGSGKLVWNIELQEAPLNSLPIPANLKAGNYFYKINNEANLMVQSGKVLIKK
ncbi:MAG: T9SS type A sorting domain-containing protein [Saprospiraceae bacterium]